MIVKNHIKNSEGDNYIIVFNKHLVTPKPVTVGEAAFQVFKLWAEYHKASLKMMEDAFPVSLNSVYSNKTPEVKSLFHLADSDHQYNGITNLTEWKNNDFNYMTAVHFKELDPLFAALLNVVAVTDPAEL